MRFLPVVLSAALAACSRGPAPEAQKAHVDEWQALRQAWSATEGNSIRRDAAEAEARAFFKTPRQAVGWVGKVDAVKSALGSTWLDVEHEGITFMLRPAPESERQLLSVFASLNRGDVVLFDGTLVGELSLTMAGGLRSPEISVVATRVARR